MTDSATSNRPHWDVVVIGAGLAGLRAAIEIHRAGSTVLLLEKSNTPGGRVQTDIIDGYRCDRGFQVYLDSYPEGQSILQYGDLKLRHFIPGARIWHSGTWRTVGDPYRCPELLFPTLVSGMGSFLDQLRILRLRWNCEFGLRPETIAPQSTESFLRSRGFSDTILDRFFRPFYGGILLDRSLQGSARFFAETFRYFSNGLACVPELGMGAIPDQLAGQLPDDSVRCNSRVVKLDKAPGRWLIQVDGQPEVTTKVVLAALDRPSAARLIEKFVPQGSVSVQDSGDVGTTCFWIATRNPLLRSRFVHLNAEPERGPIHNLAELSSVCPQYLPDDPKWQGLVAATVLDSELRMDTVDRPLQDQVLAQLKGWFGEKPLQDSRILTTQRIPFAQPSQHTLDPWEKSGVLGQGLFLAGDYLTYSSIQGALSSGRRAGLEVLKYLKTSHYR